MDYEIAVDTERSERSDRYSDHNSTDRTSVTFKTQTELTEMATPSPDLMSVEIDQEGTWDEFSFGSNPETTDRVCRGRGRDIGESINSFNSGELQPFRKHQCPIPKVPKLRYDSRSSSQRGRQSASS
jgi:hypothetical protein